MSVPKHPARNVIVRGHRTSVRLEPEVFEALEEICGREQVTLAVLCNRLLDQHGDDANLSSLLRVHALTYFRALAGAQPWPTTETLGMPRRAKRRASGGVTLSGQIPGVPVPA